MRTIRIFLTALLIVTSISPALAADSVKVTSIVDGDTFKAKIGKKVETIRIIGIDTPETKDPRKPVQCFGKEATKKLQSLLRGKMVTLMTNPAEDRDKYKRLLRYVELKGEDIGATMIEEGYAFSYEQYPHPRLDAYSELEESARGASEGLWSACPSTGSQDAPVTSPKSTTAMPAGTSSPANTAPSPPKQQCAIKGNISTTGKIYHMRGCSNYERTEIDEAAGERYFCTEQEATAAGWRKAGNC